jgi:putative ABC transport system permease protein
MKDREISEIAIRLKDPGRLDEAYARLSQDLQTVAPKDAASGTAQKAPESGFEVHTWAALSPFSNIANMIDLLTVFIKVLLVSIVLISVMNVMIMAVYERIREIGTISAIGTPPRRILALFLSEGLLLGVGGTLMGVALSLAGIYALNVWKVSFDFGQQKGLILSPWIGAADVAVVAGMVLAVTLLASLQPAWKASRMDPVRALGHV